MKKIVINGGRPLKGEVTISGAKNSVVALIPATILADDIVTLDGVPDISDVASLIEIMTISEDSIFVEKQTGLKAIQIKTSPYPGFATDLQQPITPLLLTAAGRGRIVDTIYEKRVNHVPELAKMGATISTLNDHIIYEGPNQLTGSSVKATDLRAGAALVIAGLMASGTTEITNVEYILRGYSDIIHKLTQLGADIQLVEE